MRETFTDRTDGRKPLSGQRVRRMSAESRNVTARTFHFRERIMNRAGVLKQVAAELTHIPSWPGKYQGMLRSVYRMWRANSLGGTGRGSAKDVLHRCIATVWRDFPGARFEYDRGFFDD
jgi:hypothetical protein